MERGLLVELSPKEESALVQFSLGAAHVAPDDRYVARLRTLSLNEGIGVDFKLTTLGSRRLVLRRPIRQSPRW